MTKATARRRQPEKAEQAAIVQLLRTIGATVYVLGHPSPADGRLFRGTGQSSGLPDLVAIIPPRWSWQSRHTLVMVEVKAPKGRLRPEQARFRELCGLAGVAHVVGGVDAVIAWLTTGGWLTREQVPHYRRPPITTSTEF